jgi:chromosome partitioning protein
MALKNQKTIVVFGNKGGTGKSMLAEHLAVYLAETDKDRSVVLIDLDARQGDSLLFASGRSEKWQDAPVVDAFAPKDVPELKAAFKRLAEVGTNVVVDCPPADSPLAMEACGMADAIIFPFRAGAHDLRALGRATEIARATYRPDRPPVLLAAVNFFDQRTLEARIALDALKERSDVFTFIGVIGQRTSINEALMSNLAAWELRPKSPAAKETRSVCANAVDALNKRFK